MRACCKIPRNKELEKRIHQKLAKRLNKKNQITYRPMRHVPLWKIFSELLQMSKITYFKTSSHLIN